MNDASGGSGAAWWSDGAWSVETRSFEVQGMHAERKRGNQGDPGGDRDLGDPGGDRDLGNPGGDLDGNAARVDPCSNSAADPGCDGSGMDSDCNPLAASKGSR